MKNTLEKLKKTVSFDEYNLHISDLTTSPSMKGSLVSNLSKRCNLLESEGHLNQKDRIIHVLSANLRRGKTEITLEDGWEELDLGHNYEKINYFISPRPSKARNPGNFQKKYLELGQWPEMNYQDQQKLKTKCKKLKSKLKESLTEPKPCSNPSECNKCLTNRTKEAVTKLALSEALQLSNILLKEVLRLQEDLNCEKYLKKFCSEHQRTHTVEHNRRTVSFVIPKSSRF